MPVAVSPSDRKTPRTDCRPAVTPSDRKTHRTDCRPCSRRYGWAAGSRDIAVCVCGGGAVLDLMVAQSDLAGSEVVLLFFPCFLIHLHSSKPVICRSTFVVRRADESRRCQISV